MRPIVKLGEICDVISGQSPESQFYNEKGEGLPFFQGKTEFTDRYIGKPRVWTTKTTKESIKNDILMSVRAPVGPVNINGFDKICIGRGLCAIRPGKLVDLDYVFDYLLGIQDKISGNTGAVFASINRKDIESIEIPLPPLETQKAIVAKLDQIFAELDQTKSEIQKNLDNTDELWKSAYDLKIEELKEKYGLKKLEEICSLITDGSHFSPKTTTKGLPYITVKDIDDEGNIDTENSKKISEEDFAVLVQNGCQPKKGDVLYSKDGTIGKIHLVNDENFVVLSSLAIIRPGKDVKSEYLYQIFHSNFFEKQAVGNKTGAAIKRIVLKTIKSLQIPVPPLSEQEKIVEHLDQVSKEVKELKSQYQSQLDNLEELKKSVLDKAFRGELG